MPSSVTAPEDMPVSKEKTLCWEEMDTKQMNLYVLLGIHNNYQGKGLGGEAMKGAGSTIGSRVPAEAGMK